MLKLYFGRGTCSLASHISLLEAQLPFEALELDFSRNEQQSEEYLRINPKGRVPALVTPNGPLTETPAILAYIAAAAPSSVLAMSSDPFAAAEVHSFNSYLCSTVHVAHAHRMRGHRWANDPSSIEDMKSKVPETVGSCLEMIERHMFKGPWVHGDYSISDPYLFTISRWLEGDGVDISKFPKVSSHRNRMLARPAVEQALRQTGEKVPVAA